MNVLKTLSIATAAALIAGSTSAASLSFVEDGSGTRIGFGVDFNGNAFNYDSNCSNSSGGFDNRLCYNPSGPAGALTENLTAFDAASTGPGLSVSSNARMTVTFLGKEAGAQNFAFSSAGGELDNRGAIGESFSVLVAAGTLDFAFRSLVSGTSTATNSGEFTNNASIAFSEITGGTSVYGFFDDSGGNNDRDWDDMVVLIEISAVPLPAGILLLGTALGGLGLARRRKKA